MGWSRSIVASAAIINNIQTMISRRSDLTKGMAVITVGHISGGTAANIIPKEVDMEGTIRTNNEDIRQNILQQLPEMVTHTALANNVKAEIELSPYAPVTYNNKMLTQLILPTLENTVGKIICIVWRLMQVQVTTLHTMASLCPRFIFHSERLLKIKI